MKIIGIDFFCGCGGVSYGFKRAGINMLMGIDNDLSVKIPYELNNTPAKFINADILDTDYNAKIVKEALKSVHYDHSIFAACAPCQPFSSQNKKYSEDDRKSLLMNFYEVIARLDKAYLPTFIFFENVGPMKLRGKKILEKILDKLSNLNYSYLSPKVLNAADFGVPQSRKRLIILAVNDKKIKINWLKYSWDYFYSNYSERHKTVKEAIGHLPPIKAGTTHISDSLHTSRKLSDLNLKRLRQITQPGGSRDMWRREDRLKCHENYKGHKDVYGRMAWDKPAPTLTTKCLGISNGRFGHPVQDRAISLREAAILQSMEKFKFGNNLSNEKIARMIGNAVPPLLAKKFAQFIIELLEE